MRKRLILASLAVAVILAIVYAALPKFAGIPRPLLQWMAINADRYEIVQSSYSWLTWRRLEGDTVVTSNVLNSVCADQDERKNCVHLTPGTVVRILEVSDTGSAYIEYTLLGTTRRGWTWVTSLEAFDQMMEDLEAGLGTEFFEQEEQRRIEAERSRMKGPTRIRHAGMVCPEDDLISGEGSTELRLRTYSIHIGRTSDLSPCVWIVKGIPVTVVSVVGAHAAEIEYSSRGEPRRGFTGVSNLESYFESSEKRADAR